MAVQSGNMIHLECIIKHENYKTDDNILAATIRGYVYSFMQYFFLSEFEFPIPSEKFWASGVAAGSQYKYISYSWVFDAAEAK